MDRVEQYREIVKRLIREVAAYGTPSPEVVAQTIFDDEHGHYMLFYTGWDGSRRVHHSVIHIDLVGDKVWVQRDGTNLCIVDDLSAGGITHDRIVLGFHHPDVRHRTSSAV